MYSKKGLKRISTAELYFHLADLTSNYFAKINNFDNSDKKITKYDF